MLCSAQWNKTNNTCMWTVSNSTTHYFLKCSGSIVNWKNHTRITSKLCSVLHHREAHRRVWLARGLFTVAVGFGLECALVFSCASGCACVPPPSAQYYTWMLTKNSQCRNRKGGYRTRWLWQLRENKRDIERERDREKEREKALKVFASNRDLLYPVDNWG